MENPIIVRPNELFKESYIDALYEGFYSNTKEEILNISKNFSGYIKTLDKDGQQTLSKNTLNFPSVPSLTYWTIDKEKFIGSFTIRSRIDTYFLINYIGHIGYAIRPSCYNLGYATFQLKEALKICKGMGIGSIRITCSVENLASKRVIEKCGGIYLRTMDKQYFSKSSYHIYEIILLEDPIFGKT